MDSYSTTDLVTVDTEEDIKNASFHLEDPKNLDPLIKRIGDARVVLLGEASHGTHEYYTWRTHITQRLIKEKGFDFVAVEGDWPDCYRINRYAKHYPDAGNSAREVLHEFDRWPTWMWANWEVDALVEWMRDHNSHHALNNRVGFYGLDVYSLWESMDAVVNYLQQEDPEAVEHAMNAMQCFEPYADQEGRSYGRATRMAPVSCEDEVVELLEQIRKKVPQYNTDQEAVFSTEQNALVMVNAEKYYRTMVQSGPKSWNIRDKHMTETLKRLLDFHGSDSKAIVWEHNSHVGDARATDMARNGIVNVGQLARRQFKKENVYIVGFGSYAGKVIASSIWGAPMKELTVPEARAGSWEEVLHSIFQDNRLIMLDRLSDPRNIGAPYDHRAIGVVYHPDSEEYGNYVPSEMPQRYDAFVFIDQSTALHPLHLKPNGRQMPETYPWGI